MNDILEVQILVEIITLAVKVKALKKDQTSTGSISFGRVFVMDGSTITSLNSVEAGFFSKLNSCWFSVAKVIIES